MTKYNPGNGLYSDVSESPDVNRKSNVPQLSVTECISEKVEEYADVDVPTDVNSNLSCTVSEQTMTKSNPDNGQCLDVCDSPDVISKSNIWHLSVTESNSEKVDNYADVDVPTDVNSNLSFTVSEQTVTQSIPKNVQHSDYFLPTKVDMNSQSIVSHQNYIQYTAGRECMPRNDISLKVEFHTGNPSYVVFCCYVNHKDWNKENLHTFFFFPSKDRSTIGNLSGLCVRSSVSITASKY